MLKKILLAAVLFVSFNGFAQMTNQVKEVKGKKVKVYLVQAGETVFALSRKFEVPASELLQLNPTASQGLSIGQEFYIPMKDEGTKQGKTHQVVAGETLSSISRQYGVSVDELMKANGLTSTNLSLGQKLNIPGAEASATVTPTQTDAPVASNQHKVEPGETLFSISRRFNVPVSKLMELNKLKSSDLSVGQVLTIKEGKAVVEESSAQSSTKENQTISNTTSTTTSNQTETSETTESTVKEEIQDETITNNTQAMPVDEYVEVVEQGVAQLIPDTESTQKYLAMHRTIKPGTIIRVRNETNGKEVWTRVIGQLPDTGDNKDVLIKISKAAYDRLGAKDKKFRVTITYIP